MNIIILMIFLVSGLIGMNQEKNPEIHMLSALINSECDICPEFEQYLVGSVVLNRMQNSRWPNTLKEVIEQENQFHGFNTKNYKPSKESSKVARNLLKGIG